MPRKLSARPRARLRPAARALVFAAALALPAPRAGAQEAAAPRPPAPRDEEVVRINSELVQTDVAVFDKAGHFVEGLTRDQIELHVDGKPQAVSFFEPVKAGTFDEEAQLAAARGRPRAGAAPAAVRPLDRGRVFLLFFDDLHIRPGNIQRAREAVLRFVDEQLGQNDSAAVFSASGQLGFLQQLTDDRGVLRLAIKRLSPRWADTGESGEQNPITEFQAFAIERGDRTVLNYFIDRLTRERCFGASARPRGAGTPRVGAQAGGGCSAAALERIVRARASTVVALATQASDNTLTSLENVVRTAAALPGRKLLFFVSEGFSADAQGGTTTEKMRRVSSLASRSGTVLYSLDANGLRTSSLIREAGEKSAFDGQNALGAVNSAELGAYQGPLHTLAADSGGRALLDTNDTLPAMRQAVEEASRYYLLAWRPEGEVAGGGKLFRVEARVKGRPDLSVRVRRGVSAEPPEGAQAAAAEKKHGKEREKEKKNEVEEGLMSALKSLYPKRALPTSLAAGFTDTPGGDPTLTVSVEVDPQVLGLEAAAEPVTLDVVGTVVNVEGKAVSEFAESLSVTRQPAGPGRRRVVYNRQLQLKPGLYQVRAAARDRRGGAAGSAYQWVEVPELGKGAFALSSLFVGEVGSGASQLSVCADRRFARDSRLGFFLYVYNAARGSAPPDVALQVQIHRDDQPVVTKPLFKLDAAGAPDPARLSYGEDLALGDLPAGRYVLQVTAIDRAGKASVSRSASFVIE